MMIYFQFLLNRYLHLKIVLNLFYNFFLNFELKNFDLSKPVDITAKIRYSIKDYKATLIVDDDNLKKDGCNNSISRDKIAIVKFDEPQRAITPGQSVVFYLDDGVVLGGGKIM